MLDNTPKLCGAWDLESVSVPPRSRLYPVDPIGLETPETESLTSYISRLAETHGLHPGVLVKHEITPIANVSYGLHGWRSNSSIGSVNGVGTAAARMAAALDSLTHRTDLKFLTFTMYAHVLPRTALLRRGRAWCPACLAEWQGARRTIHEPLLWTLQVVEVCVRHRCCLSVRCPYPACGKRSSPLGWRMRPGHCGRCGRWLGVVPRTGKRHTHDVSGEELAWHSWVEKNVGQLIAAGPTLAAPPPASRVAEALAACIDRSTDGNLMEFARKMQILKNFVSAWRSGDVLPQLSSLLRICYVARTPLLRFLTDAHLANGQQGMPPSGDRPMWFPPRLRRRRFDAVKVRRTLLRAIDDVDHPSFEEVARRVGHDPQTLLTHFPNLCRAIRRHHAAHVRAKREQKNRRLRKATREAVITLCKAGVYPSSRNVATHLGRPAYRHYDVVRAEWQKTLDQVGRGRIRRKPALNGDLGPRRSRRFIGRGMVNS